MVCSLRNALQDCSGHCLLKDTLDASVLEFQDQHHDVVVVVPDICSFFLDDGLCAGSGPVVRCFLAGLVEGFRRIGLEVNLEKTEVIPPCTTSQSFGPADFPSCCWNGFASFKLLCAPIGSKVAKVRTLLDAISRFPDPQGSFCLLRSCTRWAKVLYSCRTVPPVLQPDLLRAADTDIRSSLSPRD